MLFISEITGERIILSDTPVKINSFLDDLQPDSTLEFEGIDQHLKYLEIEGHVGRMEKGLDEIYLKVMPRMMPR